jgi:hypothetical protein
MHWPLLADFDQSHCNMVVQCSERPDPAHFGHSLVGCRLRGITLRAMLMCASDSEGISMKAES